MKVVVALFLCLLALPALFFLWAIHPVMLLAVPLGLGAASLNKPRPK